MIKYIICCNSVPAASLIAFGEGICLEDTVPRQPDLVILEHLPYLEGAGTIQRASLNIDVLLNRLQLIFDLPLLPPIIFINIKYAQVWMGYGGIYRL